jgi:hypothetical protein
LFDKRVLKKNLKVLDKLYRFSIANHGVEGKTECLWSQLEVGKRERKHEKIATLRVALETQNETTQKKQDITIIFLVEWREIELRELYKYECGECV